MSTDSGHNHAKPNDHPPQAVEGGRGYRSHAITSRARSQCLSLDMRIIQRAVASAVSTAIACASANDQAHPGATQESLQTGPGIQREPSLDPVDQYAFQRKRLLDQIERAKQRWRALNIRDYSLTVQLHGVWSARRYEMIFRDGRMQTGWASEQWPNERSSRYEMDTTEGERLKVEGLLEWARSEVLGARVPKHVTVRFDPQFGYPVETSSDDPQMFDDEVTYIVTAFFILNPVAP